MPETASLWVGGFFFVFAVFVSVFAFAFVFGKAGSQKRRLLGPGFGALGGLLAGAAHRCPCRYPGPGAL